MEKGFVHVYTGHGKGKTTAAIGLAVRALGQGMRVLVVQFLKGGGAPSGEISFLRDKTIAQVLRFTDQRHPIFCAPGECDMEALKASVRAGFLLAMEHTLSGRYDLVVLDELNNVMREGWLDAADAAKLIRGKPAHVELVLTGRGCPDEIIKLADYVTEMRLVKHPAEEGVAARKGVEF